MDTKLKTVLALLLSSGPLALSAALAPPANGAVITPAEQGETQSAAQRLAAI